MQKSTRALGGIAFALVWVVVAPPAGAAPASECVASIDRESPPQVAQCADLVVTRLEARPSETGAAIDATVKNQGSKRLEGTSLQVSVAGGASKTVPVAFRANDEAS